MSEQPHNPASETPALQEAWPVRDNPRTMDASELTDEFSRSVWALPQRNPLSALVDLALHHPALAETCRPYLEDLAASGLIAERGLAIELAQTLAHRDPRAAIALATSALEPIPASAGDDMANGGPLKTTMQLLASSQLMSLLLQCSWDSYEQIAPILNRMICSGVLGEPQASSEKVAALAERAAANAVSVACVAACQHPEALDLIRMLDAESPTRRAATAMAMAQMVPLAHAPLELLDELASLFDDPDDEVARQAGLALYNLPDDKPELIRRLLPPATTGRTFEMASSPIVRCLERIDTQAPDLVLQVATRFFDLYGHAAADIRTAAPPDATMLSALIVSTYATHLDGQAVSRQCLDLIDRGILCGTWDIEKHMDLLDR